MDINKKPQTFLFEVFRTYEKSIILLLRNLHLV